MGQISVSQLTFYYDGSFDNIFENVSFFIDTDWKLGLIGRNGKGKTTFLNLLLGKFAYKGSINTTTHSLMATNTTGKQVSEATSLPIKRYLSGRGGAEQILALLSCNEVDVLLFFRDPINPKATDANDMDLLRLCDVHNVPVATNIATAEALILALERGDLDWREAGNVSI